MEFVAQQIEKFRADPVIKRVFTMIDWEERRIDLGIPFEPSPGSGELKPPVLTYRLIAAALQTQHKGEGGLSSIEAAIRDHFDVFLDYLSHFEHFIQAKFVKPIDIFPHIEYWTSVLAGNQKVDFVLLDSFWRFVDVYGYNKARQLISRFHPEVARRFPRVSE